MVMFGDLVGSTELFTICEKLSPRIMRCHRVRWLFRQADYRCNQYRQLAIGT